MHYRFSAKMATEAASQPVEDDEAWLYGDENKNTDQTSSEKSASGPAGKEEKKDDREAGELSGEEESQEKDDDDDDDDSDDDVQVTIGDIQTFPLNEAPRNLFKTQGGYQKTSGAGSAIKPQGVSSVPQKGVDIEALGTINGIPTYDYDLDTLQADEKPWRKPGADITDYFNYGFNEESWQQYCEKQRRLRGDNQSGSRIYSHQTGSTTKKDSLAPPGTDTPQNVPVLSGRKPQPVAPRKMSGTIDVIGGTARDSRRPEGEPIQVAGSRKSYTSSVPTHPPPGMPDYSIPPPGVPPPGMPPPGMHHPPPGLGVPPPGVPPGVPPPGFPPEYDPFFPPPGQPPSGRYDERNPYGYEAPHTTYTTSYPDTHTSSWDRTEAYWRDYVGRDRSPPRSDSEFSSSGSERDFRYRDSGSSSRRHERDRDNYRRERDTTRDRDRDRSRERDRTRDHRHRDEKHKSRRKDKDEDSDHHRSKHKKSKRSKRDRDEEYDSTNPQDSQLKAD